MKSVSWYNWGSYLIQGLQSIEWLDFSEIRLAEALVEAIPLGEFTAALWTWSGGCEF